MKLPFDEIYLLNLCERQDKYEIMRNRIDYMGWDVKDFRVVKHPISQIIVNEMTDNLRGNGYAIYTGGVFNCTREEYTIIKSAYLRGLNTVGIIEDDCSFYKDISVWEEYFNNLPTDWDILRINCLRNRGQQQNLNNKFYWFKQNNSGIWGTGFYVLNRNGMKYMIDAIDKQYQPIDNPLAFPTDKINIYLPKIELSLSLEDSFDSDIRDNIKNSKYCFIHNSYKQIIHFKRENYI